MTRVETEAEIEVATTPMATTEMRTIMKAKAVPMVGALRRASSAAAAVIMQGPMVTAMAMRMRMTIEIDPRLPQPTWQ